MKFEVDRDSLIELSKKIYEEACMGYMDLKDAVCEQIVEDFISKIPKKSVEKIEESTNLPTASLVTTNDMNYMLGGVGSSWYVGVDIGSQLSPDITLRNVDESMLNYRGNESERM